LLHSGQSMLFGWTRAVVLLAAGVLMANAECYCICLTITCGSTDTPSGGCHHNKSSQQSSAGCVHQHPEFAGPEVGIAEISIATPTALLPMLTADSSAAARELRSLSQPDTGSPPGNCLISTISVLRI